jgi:hypothetical protein
VIGFLLGVIESPLILEIVLFNLCWLLEVTRLFVRVFVQSSAASLSWGITWRRSGRGLVIISRAA